MRQQCSAAHPQTKLWRCPLLATGSAIIMPIFQSIEIFKFNWFKFNWINWIQIVPWRQLFKSIQISVICNIQFEAHTIPVMIKSQLACLFWSNRWGFHRKGLLCALIGWFHLVVGAPASAKINISVDRQFPFKILFIAEGLIIVVSRHYQYCYWNEYK